MKNDSTTLSTSGGNYSNSNISMDSKYDGLIKQSIQKKVRNRLYGLLGYIDNSSPMFLPLHAVVTFFRFLQLLGPSLCAASPRFWPMGELHQKVSSYFSVFFHIIPVEYRGQAAVYFEFIYVAVVVFYFVLVILSGFIFRNTSKLPRSVVLLISILNSSVMHLIHPVALQLASQEISKLIMGMKTDAAKAVEIVAIIFTFACAICYAYIYFEVMSITLLFRPSSFLTTANNPQFYLTLTTYLVTVISGVATYLPKIPYIILMIFSSLSMFSTIYLIFMPGSFVRQTDIYLVFASCITGGIEFIVVTIHAAIDKTNTMAVLFIFCGIFVISMGCAVYLSQMNDRSCLKKLDEISDDQNAIDSLKNPGNLIRVACIGFKYAHPVCIDWSIFRGGTERWSESVILWAVFGKFVAIYPEENNLLSYIIHNIEAKKLKGGLAKQTIAQGRLVLTQRETSLSSELKKKMQKVGKAVQNAKRKLRHIWDLVIQGNTHEMENAVNNAFVTVLKTQADFNHVLSEYPNNRFIARAYARFLQEITADHKSFFEWVEKVKILQRGISATIDHTNSLGITAFPMLPPVLSAKGESTVGIGTVETESAFSLETDIEDEQSIQMNEQMAGIREQISSLKIPALRTITTMAGILFLVFLLAPVVVIFCIAPGYINSLNKPLQFMYYLSYLRTLNYQLPSFAFHWIFQIYPKSDPLFITPNYDDVSTESLGGSKDTRTQFKYLGKELTMSLESIGQFRSYEADNPILAKARDLTYKSQIPYYYYNVHGDNTTVYFSIQSALMDYSIQLSKLGDLDEITPDILISHLIMNPIANVNSLGNTISEAIESVLDYLDSINEKMQFTMTITMIVLAIVFVFLYVGLVIYEMRLLQSNKNETYRCLTSLPKNVVSGLAESLRILKKDTEGSKSSEVDSEVNKQEDNILKIFATAGDSSGAVSSDRFAFFFCHLLLLAIEILVTYFFTELFKDVTKKLRQNGPQLNYVLGAPAYMMGTYINLDLSIAVSRSYFTAPMSINEMLNSVSGLIDKLNYFYHRARYGGETNEDPPFIYFNEINDYAQTVFSCPDENAIPADFREIYTCFNADQQTTLFESLIEKIVLPIMKNQASTTNTHEEMFTELWYMSAVLLYESFFNPMFKSILPQLKIILDSAIPNTMPQIIICLVVALILVIAIYMMVSADAAKLRFALSLLLHCPAQVVMQTQKITEVIGGNFTSQNRDLTTRSSEFFTEVVSHLPDSIIIVNNQMQIVSINKSTERIYGVSGKDLINMDAHEFFSSSSFSEDVSSVISSVPNKPPTLVRYTVKNGSTNHLELSCLAFAQSYVITTRDRTQVFVYNTLISEERSKSDKLLASILPANLVVRVQNGEKNISFAVQSASILFLDIVEFTPWCASNTAAMVMSTLNNLFKLLDTKVAEHSTVTKIKCIGDCYMAAGGIFDEVNQPTVHAKEIVEFGLESIGCVNSLNEQNGLTLRIRVGINTGGPIVAGVLGTEKPTFEILGPAINMAQQMEHHGVPMLVHISRNVYELIYGGSFTIKERGQIEIKSGKVITYLVHDSAATPQ